MNLLVILLVLLLCANQGENDPEEFPGDGNKGLDFLHTFFKVSLIMTMHHTAFANRIQRCKKEQLAQKRTTSFGNTPVSPEFAGTNFKEVKSGVLEQLSLRVKAIEISDLTNQSRDGDSTIPFMERRR